MIMNKATGDGLSLEAEEILPRNQPPFLIIRLIINDENVNTQITYEKKYKNIIEILEKIVLL